MNRLGASTSPYLLQHAGNPVDWYEWGEEAFSEAKRRDQPVLLSVGYSACHWCHVMAHESFEDPETAAVMNREFVNIKVDREERPDVDSIYMEAVQAMTGQGGWPMTVWLTPDGKPFYAGTYFPKSDRGGLPSFRRILAAISEAWRTDRDNIVEQARRVSDSLASDLPPAETLADGSQLDRAAQLLASSFDAARGGFGRAPKFPQQPQLEFLLRRRDPQSLHMLVTTLEAMARGGIHDQIGGGFARYSVDAEWLVPHFEKMLYDNAQLLHLYLWTGIETERPDLIEIARGTADYLLTDLRNDGGGFMSAEDADSEGEEGKFYVWSYDEFVEVAGEDSEWAVDAYGVSRSGNFEGTNVLLGLKSDPRLAPVRKRLLERRNQRVRPGKDDKVIAAWNGLAIHALAEAGAALSEPEYIDAAKAAATFVVERMTSGDGGLVRTWAKGKAGATPGFLDDYAAMGNALLTLYAATGELDWYQRAEGWIRSIPVRFVANGVMYSTESDDLIKRPRDFFDNPSPSGTSLASEALLRLAALTGDDELRQAGLANLKSVTTLVDRYPGAIGYALALLDTWNRPNRELAVVGDDRTGLEAVFWAHYRPQVVLAPSAEPTEAVPLLVGREGGVPALAYLCSGMVCQLPTSSPDQLASLLASSPAPSQM